MAKTIQLKGNDTMKKPNVLKSNKAVLVLICMMAAAVIYHTGVKGEKDCIAKGYNAGYCAKLLD